MVVVEEVVVVDGVAVTTTVLEMVVVVSAGSRKSVSDVAIYNNSRGHCQTHLRLALEPKRRQELWRRGSRKFAFLLCEFCVE